MKKDYLPWIYLFLLALIWGSSFILMKRGLEVFNYTEVAAMRLGLACLSLLPFGIKYFKRVKRKEVWAMAAVGIVGNGIPAFLFTKSQTAIDSSLAGILNALTPLFTVFIGAAFFQLKFKPIQILGVGLGLAGAIWLVNPGEIQGNTTWYYPLYVVAATLCYAISVNIIKTHLGHLSSVQVTLTGLCFAAPAPIFYLLFGSNLIYHLEETPGSWEAFFYIFILAAIGTALSVVLFNELIKKTTAIFASSVTYLIPVIATLWGILDGEEIKLYYLLAMGLILTGVYLVNRKKKA